MNKIVAFAFVAFFASATAGPIVAGYHGTCPDVSFVKDFDFSKFKGMWYAIKETGMQIPCVTYNLEETRANHYHATEMPENLLMEFDKKNADDFTDGFSMKFQVNPFMDNADVKIFHLDDSYAGVYMCKQFTPDLYFPTVTYWSRTRSMPEDIVKHLDEDLLKYSAVDLSLMNMVKNDDCEA